jgi:hypothetical protein
MENQATVTEKMRSILINWLTEVSIGQMKTCIVDYDLSDLLICVCACMSLSVKILFLLMILIFCRQRQHTHAVTHHVNDLHTNK